MDLARSLPRAPWRDRRGRVSPLRALALGAALLPGLGMTADLLADAYAPRPMVSLIYYTGVWSMVLLLVTLAISPLRRILRWNALIGVRRILGVAALAYGLVHTLVYFLLREWDWSLMGWELTNRLTIPVAIVATAGLCVLGATSFDAAIRRLGAHRWRALHRAIYVLAGLALAHFLMSPGSIGGLPFTMAGCYLWLMAWRVLDARGLGDRPAVLAGLAVAVAAATLLLEMLLPWWGQGYDPIETLRFAFTLDLGIAAAWEVLGLGLVMAGLAFVGQRSPHGALP